MFSWYKVWIFSQTDLLYLEIYPLKIFPKIICIKRTARRAVSSCHLFHGHVLLIQGLNFQLDKLTCSQDIPTQSFFWKTVCIKRTARRGVSSCHLFDGHVLLIQGLNFQPDRSTISRDIPTQNFSENHLYQKNRSKSGLVVPPLPWSCSPDTRFEFSAR